jgi:hypothetical protein
MFVLVWNYRVLFKKAVHPKFDPFLKYLNTFLSFQDLISSAKTAKSVATKIPL